MVSPVHGRLKMCIDHHRLLRLPEVLRMTGLSRSTLYRLIGEGRFPAPVRIGPRAVAWRERDVLEWQETRPVVSRR